MVAHVKVICISVGLLLALSGLNSVSFAVSHPKPAPSEPVSVQSAQGSLAAAVAFRAVVNY